jgi:hypothetical protein
MAWHGMWDGAVQTSLPAMAGLGYDRGDHGALRVSSLITDTILSIWVSTELYQ